MGRRQPRGAAAWAVVVALALGGTARAAILEFDLRQGVADSVAVMRYLYKQTEDAKDKLKMVRYSIDLTKSQLEVQQALIEKTRRSTEPEEAKKIKMDHFRKTLRTLQVHMEKMTGVNWEDLFANRVNEAQKQLMTQKILLDAKLAEYRVHFGGEPPVDLTYEEAESRLRPKIERPGLLLVR